MNAVLYSINLKENPNSFAEKCVPDYVFFDEMIGRWSVTELLREGINGMHMLAVLMNDYAERSDAQDMHNAVSQALSEKIGQIYEESGNEHPRDFLGAVATIIDFIPFFRNVAYDYAVELRYENLYDLLLHGDDKDVYRVCEMMVEKISNNVVLLITEPEERKNPFLRANVLPGLHVKIVLKKDQSTGKLTEGYVKDILTSAPVHTRGIKVRLLDGQIGRVKQILN